MSAPPVDGHTVGSSATARELGDRGLAQVLAAALWDAEPGHIDPLPTTVPALMDDDDPAYAGPSPATIALAQRTAIPPLPPPPTTVAVPVADLTSPPSWFTERLDELLRLQVRQHDHVEKLHEENRLLREGELAAAMAPLLQGLAKLGDQMDLLASAEGPGSSAALLRTQLHQVLGLAAGVTAYQPLPGTPFDVATQRGVRAVEVGDPAYDGLVSSTVRPGYARANGTVVRVAEVEVYRFRADKTTGTASDGAAA